MNENDIVEILTKFQVRSTKEFDELMATEERDYWYPLNEYYDDIAKAIMDRLKEELKELKYYKDKADFEAQKNYYGN